MIKRRFYKQDHADKNDASDSFSSSSSDSDSDSIEEVEEEEDTAIAAPNEEEKPISASPGSGYETEDSSGNEVDCDTSGLLFNDDESTGKDSQSFEDSFLRDKGHVESAAEMLSTDVVKAFNAKDSTQAELADYVLKCKSVFKCRLCPRIVCLTEDTLRTHLKSKRHARSKKLLDEGRLRLMLNSDGEIEEDLETHAERHARTVSLTQDLTQQKKKNKGRQRQRQRLKKKKSRDASEEGRTKQNMEKPTKKRRKL